MGQITKMTTVEARNKFSDLISRVFYGKEHIILTRRGRDLVAVVPLEDLKRLGKEPGSISDEKVKMRAKARPEGYHR